MMDGEAGLLHLRFAVHCIRERLTQIYNQKLLKRTMYACGKMANQSANGFPWVKRRNLAAYLSFAIAQQGRLLKFQGK